MPEETLAKSVRKIRSAEQWAEARRLYEEGLSLEGVGAKLGISYKTVWYHAWVEGWPVRSRGAPRDPRYQAAKAKQLQRKLAKEEERLAQELVLVKAEDLELLARKSLAADSARAKVAVSRRVIEILSRLEDSSVPVRSAAQALGALAPILRLIFGWGHEVDVAGIQLAQASSIVNLKLVNTSPEELAQVAEFLLTRAGDNPDAPLLPELARPERLRLERPLPPPTDHGRVPQRIPRFTNDNR